jgi:hypothetical protein
VKDIIHERIGEVQDVLLLVSKSLWCACRVQWCFFTSSTSGVKRLPS